MLLWSIWNEKTFASNISDAQVQNNNKLKQTKLNKRHWCLQLIWWTVISVELVLLWIWKWYRTGSISYWWKTYRKWCRRIQMIKPVGKKIDGEGFIACLDSYGPSLYRKKSLPKFAFIWPHFEGGQFLRSQGAGYPIHEISILS